MVELQILAAKSAPRILCLGAHSDDIEIGCGGTLLKLLANSERASVRWQVFSGNDTRAAEARASAAAFLKDASERQIVLRNHRDGFFPADFAAIKEDFEQLKREFEPDVVFTHFRNDRHQDHRVISDLAWNTFRNHLILEYEIPKYDGDLARPNAYVSLTAENCARKVNILLDSFPSQRDKQWFDEQTFTALLRLRGLECNSPTRFAEAFHARKLLVS